MKKKRRFIGLIAGLGLLLSTTTVFAEPEDSIIQIEEQSTQQQLSKAPLFKSSPTNLRKITQVDLNRGRKEGQVIVKFKQGKSLDVIGEQAKARGMKVGKVLDPELGLQLLEFDANVDSVENVIQFLDDSRIVEYAEPNYILQPDAVTDPYYGLQWGLKNTGQPIMGVAGKAGIDIKAETAWLKTKGNTSTVIAVIDTGTDIAHPDLKDNIWKNPGEIPNDKIDNDKNGYIDDVNGWNFYDNNNNVFYSPDEDDHGTHVSGTIAAKANNIGVIGVAPNVKIMPLKYLGPGGGYTSDAILAINYAKAKGVKITNNSWGGDAYSQALYDTIKSSNSLFIAAAGNDGVNNDAKPHYPSSFNLSNILSVAAITNTGSLASFSNYGATSVDVAAPGQAIASTFPSNQYYYLSGTSMATPHVTGVAALVTAVKPALTPLQIKDTIMKSVTKLSSLTGKIVTGGLINAGTAVAAGAADDDIPGVPFTGTSKSGTLNVSGDQDDVYSIRLYKGEKVTVSLTGAVGTDFNLFLYKQTTKTVKTRTGFVANSQKADTSTETFSYIAPTDGTYYIDAYALKGSGSYTLTVKNRILAGAGVYQDSNAYLIFGGTWSKVSSTSASGGSYKWANGAGANAQLIFNGTSVSINALKNSSQGIAKVTLDGVAYNVNLYSATTKYNQTVFTKTGLTAGRHVLKIEWTGKTAAGAPTGSTRINVDAITVK
ncbi:S8 family serine peptidase [Bacillus sp. JJ1764]|uniref:S8 family serine peptidase n=1 Tax=Bacillus sp. JJ1764 TaxID=3122964 RepID=UPI002FFFCD71